MTGPRNPDALIRAFLEEGQSELPDRAYDAVRDQIGRTRQRVVIGPWREPRMSGIARVAIAAAAVLVAAVIVVNFLPGGSQHGGPGPATPAPSVSPSPSPGPSASFSSGPLPYTWPGTLAPGEYSTSLIWDPFYVFHFTVGDGWQSRDIEIIKTDRMAVQFYFADNVVTNICTQRLVTPPIGGTVDNLVRPLARLVKIDVGPRPVTLGDRRGAYLEFTIGPPFDCPATQMNLMKQHPGTCGQGCGGLGPEWIGLEFGGLTEHNRMWVLQVGRGRGVINAVWTDKATAADLADLQAVIDSVRLDTPNATPPPQPAPASP